MPPGFRFPTPAWRWLLFGGYLAALLISTHIPHKHVDVDAMVAHVGGDRVAHVLAYLGLTLMLLLVCPIGRGRATVLRWGLALCALAAGDEWTQGWCDRTPDILDWASDVSGIGLGIVVAALSSFRFQEGGLR